MKMSNTDHRMTSLFAAGVLLCSGATILQAADTDGWETEFVVGLDLTSGNSETLGYNGGVMTRNIRRINNPGRRWRRYQADHHRGAQGRGAVQSPAHRA